jgi:hypothetical protein
VSASSTLEARIRGALTPLENLLISGTTTKCLSDEEFYAQEFTERPVEIICPENGVHPWLPSISRRLWQRGYSDREIFNLVYAATRGVKHRVIREYEIRDAIALIVGTPADQINGHHAAAEKPVYEPGYLAEVAARITEPVDEAYLEARSQYTCWNRSPVGFLHKLFQPGAHIWITDKYKSRQGEIWTHTGLDQRFDELDHYRTGHEGVWFLTAPIDGRLHAVDRIKGPWNPEGPGELGRVALSVDRDRRRAARSLA